MISIAVLKGEVQGRDTTTWYLAFIIRNLFGMDGII
jgi:hypothetical protein